MASFIQDRLATPAPEKRKHSGF